MIKQAKKIVTLATVTGAVLFTLTGCSMFGGSSDSDNKKTEESTVSVSETTSATEPKPISGLELEKELPIDHAEYLNIDAYKGGYYVIKSHKGSDLQQMLIVPEGGTVPEGLDENILVVKQPVTSSKIDSLTMLAMLNEIDPETLSGVSLVSNEKESISIGKVVENMDKGVTKYAGKIKEQDVNLLKESGVQFYIGNSGLEKEDIYKEIVKQGITPFITYLHVEKDPLGRLEWVKALGTIFGKTDAAQAFYDSQKQAAESVDRSKANGKTYTMVYFNKSKNLAYVRRTGDVIAKIGEYAGGKNMLSDVDKGSWEEMSIDDFASKFKDSDYLIYFDGHGDKVSSRDELLAISDKLNDFKAVKDGHVWRTQTDYLQMAHIGDMIKELNGIFADDAETINNAACYVNIK